MREIYIIGNSSVSLSPFKNSSLFKNSIARRAPYRNSCNIICNTVGGSGKKYISPLSIKRYFNTTQLKICKVS